MNDDDGASEGVGESVGDGAQEATLDPARFGRLLEVVSLASVGEYAAALGHFEAMREDEFGMLEEGLRVFISELMSGHAAREQATAELLQAREELEQKPLGELKPFLDPGTYPDAVRGTLRDSLTYLLVELLVDTANWRPEQNDLYRFDFAALLRGDAKQALITHMDDQTVHPLTRAVLALDDLESWHRRSDRPAAALEARLGVKLIARSTRSLRLTSAGQAYLERARDLLEHQQHLDGPASDATNSC